MRQLRRGGAAAALVLGLGFALVSPTLLAGDASLSPAFAALREPVVAGRFRSVLTALDDLEARLEQARIAALEHALPPPLARWRVTDDAWRCLEGLHGARTYEAADDKRMVLHLSENDQGEEGVDITTKLLDPRLLEKDRESIQTVAGRKVLVTFDTWEDGSRGVVRWALPRPDRDRMHGRLSLLTLEADGLPKLALLAYASKVDVAAIQARLHEPLGEVEAQNAAPPLLLTNASRSYVEGDLGRALAWTRRLQHRVAEDRARHLLTALPREPAGWRYDSGGLGGWPAGASKSFRRGERIRVYVGVSEAESDEIRLVQTRLADPSSLQAGERLAELGGRKALLIHEPEQSTFLLRAPIADGTALAWVRSWDAADDGPATLFAGLMNLAALEQALRR